MYQDELIEHYKYPKLRKKLASPDFAAGHYNPSCGDRVTIEGNVTDGIVTDMGFQGSGCVISQAATSMLTEHCLGKSLAEIQQINKDDIIKMIGMELGPTRLRCALLCLEVLKQGIVEYSTKNHLPEQKGS